MAYLSFHLYFDPPGNPDYNEMPTLEVFVRNSPTSGYVYLNGFVVDQSPTEVITFDPTEFLDLVFNHVERAEEIRKWML